MIRLLLAVLLVIAAPAARAAGLTIFAAASLTDALKDVATLWQARGHAGVTFSFAASSTLAQQIIHGAPADVFASADTDWMDKAVQAGRINAATRFDLAGNRLVLVAQGDHKVDLSSSAGLLNLLGPSGRLAVGDPNGVPAGIYARQALTKLGLWSVVQDRLAPADSVRSALLLVAHGETPAGIVYETDIKATPALKIAAVFPADSHDRIVYPIAATKRARPEAADFLAFLQTPDAHDVLLHYGFPPP